MSSCGQSWEVALQVGYEGRLARTGDAHDGDRDILGPNIRLRDFTHMNEGNRLTSSWEQKAKLAHSYR